MAVGSEFTGVSNLTGFTYEIYDKLVNLVPDSAKLIRKIGYKAADKELGNKFHQNVIVSDEGGFTHAPPAAGAFGVNAAVSLVTQDAQVDGYQLVLQSSLDYEAAAKASSSRKAYAAIAETKLKNMVESTRRRLEFEVLYGQQPLGLIASAAAAVGETIVVTITAADHAPFIWAGKRGFKVIVASTADDVVTNIAAGAFFEITSVNVADDVRTVKLTGSVAGDAADLKTYVDANPNVTKLYWYTQMTPSGAPVFNDMNGIHKIVANTGSMFNIDASVYDLWAGNDFDVGSVALTFKKVIDCLAAAANRGMDENATLFVHPRAWSNLASDQAGLRRYGGEIESAKQGFSAIRFYHMTGEVEIIGHGMVKGGFAYMLPLKHFSRVGAQDVSFKTPGRNPGDDIFWHDPTKAGFSYRLYTHQAVFCDQPAKCVRLKNIVNS